MECQFKVLESCPQSEHLLDQLLVSLPQSLYETYDRMLANISSTWAEYARPMLTLLCCAMRPLTVEELIDGVAVELGDDPKFNPKRRLQGVSAIYEVCPGFIEINVSHVGQATVRIAHFSVQEYLESPQRSGTAFGVQRRQADAEIACICLTYLLEPALSASTKEEFPLTEYASIYWPRHYRRGDNTLYGVQNQALRLFRDPGGKFTDWVQILDLDLDDDHWYDNVGDYYRRQTSKKPSPIYYASRLGLDAVLSELICEMPFDQPAGGSILPKVSDLVNERTGAFRRTALIAASSGGHEAVVRLLLDKGADTNNQGGRYGTALQAASYSGREAVVRLLLDRGADINLLGGLYGTALQAASSRGSEAVFRLLLEGGADVNLQGGHYGTALQEASLDGSEAVVRLLFERGADVNLQGGRYGTALQAASYKGHEAMVRLLLERGADVHVRGGYYGTALEAALERQHEAIVQLLVDNGARPWDGYTYDEMVWIDEFFQSLGIADD